MSNGLTPEIKIIISKSKHFFSGGTPKIKEMV